MDMIIFVRIMYVANSPILHDKEESGRILQLFLFQLPVEILCLPKTKKGRCKN